MLQCDTSGLCAVLRQHHADVEAIRDDCDQQEGALQKSSEVMHQAMLSLVKLCLQAKLA